MRNYRLWGWICFGISIISILITILFLRASKINKLNNAQPIIYSHFPSSNSSIINCDSVRVQFNEVYQKYQDSILFLYSPRDIRDSVLIRQAMDIFYENLLYKFSEEYGLSKDLIESIVKSKTVNNVPIIVDSANFNAVRGGKLMAPSEKQTAIEPSKKQQDTNFGILSGSASILSLFFSVFFRYKDKKSRRIIKDGERDNEIKPIDPVSMDVDMTYSDLEPLQNKETEIEK